VCIRWCIAVDSREGRREVNGSIRGGLDKPYLLSSSATDDRMQGQFEFHDVDMATELQRVSNDR